MEKRADDKKRGTKGFFYILCGALAVCVFLKYALRLLLPFIIAAFLAVFLRPMVERVSRICRISKKASSALLLVGAFAAVSVLVFFAVNRLLSESEGLLLSLSKESEKLGTAISRLFDSLSELDGEKIPIIKNLLQIKAFRDVWENMGSVVSNTVTSWLGEVAGKIPVLLFSAFSSLPSCIIFAAVTLMASFYFCAEYDEIKGWLFARLSYGARCGAVRLKRCVFGTVINYLKASVVLFFITFAIVFCGFLILGVQSPFLLAVAVAFVDILPVLGVGTVLVPWGLLRMLLYKDIRLGVGLLLLYVIALVARRIAEPKIIGKGLGLHPLMALFTSYIGMRLFGIFGMILLPLPVAVAKSFFADEERVDKNRAL